MGSLAVLESFVRFFVGFTFAASFLSKARDVDAFRTAVRGFALLPPRAAGPLAWTFLAGELATSVLLLAPLDHRALLAGLSLALGLLLVFTAALASVLLRGLDISCNCFGASTRPVSRFDVWRNLGVAVCCGLGLAAAASRGAGVPLAMAEQLLAAAVAAVAVALWTSLAEIAALFQND